MTFSSAFESGFEVINRNWQLVAVNFLWTVLSLIGLIVVIFIPLFIVFVMAGSDISGLFNIDNLYDLPYMLFSKYTVFAIFLGILIVMYALFALTISLFVFAASCGVIGQGLKDGSSKFSFKEFFNEGKRLFFPVLGFTSIIGMIAIVGIILFAVYLLLINNIIGKAGDINSTFGHFMSIFLWLLTLVILLFLIVGTLSITIYGIGIIALKGNRIVESLKEAFSFVIEKASAFWFYGLAVAGYLIIYLFVVFIGFILGLIPFVGVVITFPYQVFVYAVQSYLGLTVLSSTFSYYYLEKNIATQID